MKTVIIWLAAVAFISVYPFKAGEPSIPHADKVFHFALYAITCALFFSVLVKERRLKKSALPLSVALSAGYGALMEAVQFFMPMRAFSIADAAANLLGAISMAALISHKRK